MPSNSIKQRNYVFYLRGKYKNKSDTPEKYKWVWDDEWLKIKKEKCIKTIEEAMKDNSEQYLKYWKIVETLFNNIDDFDIKKGIASTSVKLPLDVIKGCVKYESFIKYTNYDLEDVSTFSNKVLFSKFEEAIKNDIEYIIIDAFKKETSNFYDIDFIDYDYNFNSQTLTINIQLVKYRERYKRFFSEMCPPNVTYIKTTVKNEIKQALLRLKSDSEHKEYNKAYKNYLEEYLDNGISPADVAELAIRKLDLYDDSSEAGEIEAAKYIINVVRKSIED